MAYLENYWQDIFFMKIAINLAKRARSLDEVPIGAILVKNDLVIGKGFNCPIIRNDLTAHAEIIALKDGSNFLKNYRLPGTTLYVTIEPCLMCFGAILHARIDRLVFGAINKKFGVITNNIKINKGKGIKITNNILSKECSDLLSDYFKKKRISKKF